MLAFSADLVCGRLWAWDLTFLSSCTSKPKLGSEVERGRDIRKIRVFILGSGSGAATRLLIKGHLHLLFWVFFFSALALARALSVFQLLALLHANSKHETSKQ